MTTKKLQQIKDLWQKRLRLQDWDIQIEFVDGFGNQGTYGECVCSPCFMEAGIRVKEGLNDREIEETVVHELMHVRFPNHSESYSGIFSRTNAVGAEFEVGIEMVARALINGYKGKAKS